MPIMTIRSGIYRIVNIKDGKCYVGSTSNFAKRFSAHRWLLKGGKHECDRLRHAYAKHGFEVFKFEILERVPDFAMLLIREQYWIDHYGSFDPKNGYNICAIAGTRRGVPQPESSREASRQRFLGKPKSADHKAKISAASVERWQRTGEREKQAARCRGKPKSDYRSLSSGRQIQVLRRRAEGATYAELQKEFKVSAGSLHALIHLADVIPANKLIQ